MIFISDSKLCSNCNCGGTLAAAQYQRGYCDCVTVCLDGANITNDALVRAIKNARLSTTLSIIHLKV